MPTISWGENLLSSYLPVQEKILAGFVINNGSYQLRSTMTRGNNTLDLLIVSDWLALSSVTITCPFSTSDHNCITWCVWFPKSSKFQEHTSYKRYNFHCADYKAISMFLNEIKWVKIFSAVAPDDVNGIWKIFKNLIFKAIYLFTPISSLRGNAKHKYPNNVRLVQKFKLKLWKNRHKTGGLAKYNVQVCKCSKLIKKYHILQEQRLIDQNSESAFYRYVNKKLCSGRHVSPLHTADGTLLTDNIAKAQAFNDYFTSVFTKKFSSKNIPFVPSLTSVTHSKEISFTPDIVFKALRKAKHKLSSEPDSIPFIFWSSVAGAIALPISIILSASYVFSKLLDEWKSATIMPLYKKGDPSIVSNYRLISLTCTLCKIMEVIVKDNLLNFALTNNIITTQQNSFLPNHSTCTQMLDCSHTWQTALDNELTVDVIFIDFSKAFDVVPHKLLIHKLASLGTYNLTLRWIQAFFRDRTQVVNVNGSISSPRSVSSGVIQGSVLGPILFVL